MVLVVVDDLMFRSKISTAAKAVGATIAAATSAEAAIARAREVNPRLILLDLDSSRTQPFEVLRQLAGDPALASIPTLGFVSHVHTEAIRQARALGIGEVMARSAFSASLPDILSRAR
jgi:chemosensory pili system protein ChpA (sensor histidine kinase/response regulator)